MNWDEWRGSLDGRPTMWVKYVLHVGGWKLDIHKFVKADDEECFHTHPAHALRVVLWGGYEEEMYNGTPVKFYRVWRPGSFGIVAPSYCHRVHKLLNGMASYSLWLRTPARHTVELRGKGWVKT